MELIPIIALIIVLILGGLLAYGYYQKAHYTIDTSNLVHEEIVRFILNAANSQSTN